MALIGVASAAVERREASPLRVFRDKTRKIRRGRPHPLMRFPSLRLPALRLPSFQGRHTELAWLSECQNPDADASRECLVIARSQRVRAKRAAR